MPLMRPSVFRPTRWRPWPIAGAVTLLAVGVVMGLGSEANYRSQRIRETSVQADILAAGLSAPNAFADRRIAQSYVNALRADPDLESAGVYDATGALVAGFSRQDGALPPRAPPQQRPSYRNGLVQLSSPVIRDGRGRALGEIYLRTIRQPPYAAISRHSGLALLMVMGYLFVVVLGQVQATLRRANAELQGRALELSETNRQLQVQMEEREKAEEALRQGQKMEAIGQLTGGVAHDFNNILMVAASGLDLLDRSEDPARRKALKDSIRQAVDRGASLTRQLLAISRRTALQPQVLDLREQIESMRVLLDRSLREDISVALDLEDRLWPVEVDPNQLEVAVLNIAVNARDAMPDGGVITIEGRNFAKMSDAELVGDFVGLSIRDEGHGMDRETLRRVFEPFFTTKSAGKGTGLGLSQVYGFGRASGGDVRVESELGRGTTISLFLPRAAPGRAVAPRKAQAGSSQRRRPAELQGRILLVEDDDSVATLVTEMMRELGYEVQRVAAAAGALHLLDAGLEFEVMFTDMVMPGRMNGMDLAREVSRRRPELSIVLTTGFSEAAAAARDQGFLLLVKPYGMEALAEALEATRRDRLQRAAAG